MNITTKENYILIEIQSDFDNFFDEFNDNFNKFQKNNLIIKFNEDFLTDSQKILLLLEHSEIVKSNKCSFVLVLPSVDIDDFPETFNIVPTLTEAEDIVEMEMIERDLGF